MLYHLLWEPKFNGNQLGKIIKIEKKLTEHEGIIEIESIKMKVLTEYGGLIRLEKNIMVKKVVEAESNEDTQKLLERQHRRR